MVAEKYLETVEGTANYGILLLQLLTLESASSVIRTAAAVTFKNFIKRNWRIVSWKFVLTYTMLKIDDIVKLTLGQ